VSVAWEITLDSLWALKSSILWLYHDIQLLLDKTTTTRERAWAIVCPLSHLTVDGAKMCVTVNKLLQRWACVSSMCSLREDLTYLHHLPTPTSLGALANILPVRHFTGNRAWLVLTAFLFCVRASDWLPSMLSEYLDLTLAVMTPWATFLAALGPV
jgi:hypothetical protein